MKRLVMLLLALLTVRPLALAEEADAIPVSILPYDTQNAADNAALSALTGPQADHTMQRWEKVQLSDGRAGWVCTVFDLNVETNVTTTLMDDATHTILATDSTDTGYFTKIQARWEAAKGCPFALWSVEDKQLFHRLYVFAPSYGVPAATDLAPEEALSIALRALALESSDGYQVGYGYLMGEADVSNGIWEVFLVQQGEVIHRVNLDALTGELLYIENSEEANG